MSRRECHHFADADADNQYIGVMAKDGRSTLSVITEKGGTRSRNGGRSYQRAYGSTMLENEIEISKKSQELASMQHGNIERPGNGSSRDVHVFAAEQWKMFVVTTSFREMMLRSSPYADGVIPRSTPLQGQRVRNRHRGKQFRCAHAVAVFLLPGSVCEVGRNIARGTGVQRRFQPEHASRNHHCVVVVAGNRSSSHSERAGTNTREAMDRGLKVITKQRTRDHS
jgi:hypothetical protein